MKLEIKNKPKSKENYKLKKATAKGVTYGFIAGWMISQILNNRDQIKNGEDSLRPHMSDPTAKEDTIDDELLEGVTDKLLEEYDLEVEGDGEFIDLQPSGNSIYGNYQGVDISNLNGYVDVGALKENNIDYIIVRAFDCIAMDYENDNLEELDLSWLEKIEACKEHNIPFGIYIYSRATTEEMAEQEAVKLIKFLSKYNIRPDFPVYWDVEAVSAEPLKDEHNNFVDSQEFIYNNPEQTLKNFKAFARVMEKYGYYTGIYTSDNVLCAIDPDGTKLANYTIWDACWRYGWSGPQMDFYNDFNPATPKYKGHVDMLQFSCTGLLPGIEHELDCDLCKYNYAGIIHAKGLNKPVDYDTYFGSNPTYKEIVDGQFPKSKKR